MRVVSVLVALATSAAAMSSVDEAPREGDAKSPDGHWSVHFRQTAPDSEHGNYGEVTVYRDGRKLLTHNLPRLVARAVWSPNSKYCVFTSVNAQGHSPWNFTAYVFSTAHRSAARHGFRRLDDIVGDVTEPDFQFESPDTVIFSVLDRSKNTGESKQSRASLHEIYAKLPRDDEVYQAIQRTASNAAIDVVRVCHPAFGCVDSCSGLAVADLVSR
jgi:hypothetical protein